MYKMRNCIVMLLMFYGSTEVIGQYEGYPCTSDDGKNGICKFLTECQPALDGFKTGHYPKICSFEGTKSIVCCVGSVVTSPTTTTTKKPPVKTPTPTTTTTTRTPTVTNRLPGDISKEMCKEYAQYAYERIESPTLSIIPQYSNTLECAFEKEQLIVGGTRASRQEFPHMAQIGYVTGSEIAWACGGSLISENCVLTAAHCLRNKELGAAKLVRVGITNQTDTNHLQERKVKEIIQHPEYDFQKYNDIGLLRLESNFDLNTFVRPACLQTEKRMPVHSAIASGWGRIEFSGEGSIDLLKVVLEFFTTQKCNATYRRDINQPDSPLYGGILEEQMICAGSTKEFKDTCQGDSGGPLQIYHDNTKEIKCMYNIIGVTSFGKSCGLAKNVPGVYTRVSAYIKWIEDNVWQQ